MADLLPTIHRGSVNTGRVNKLVQLEQHVFTIIIRHCSMSIMVRSQQIHIHNCSWDHILQLESFPSTVDVPYGSAP